MRTWMILLMAIVAVLLAGLGYSSWSSGVPVEVTACRRGAIQEFVDEEGKTRLAETYLITMPYDGRIEPIELVEGASVTKGQTVARIKPVDVELSNATTLAAVNRLKASIKENDDTTVETTALKQTISLVESIDRMVEAAATQVKSGQANLEFTEKQLARTQRLVETNSKTQEDLDQARLSHVESSATYHQNVLVLQAAEAMRAAMVLLPTAVRQYIQRKVLAHDVLEQQLAEAEVRMREAQKNEKLAVMNSPIDGVVLERALSNERQVAAGTVLLQIGRWEDLEIEADLLSQDVVRVKPGQNVEVHGAAIGQQPAKAQVTRIFPAGFTKVSSLGVEQQRVKVIMKFEPDDWRRLREHNDLGVHYRVRVRIYTARASGALLIPRSALFRGTKNDWQVFAVRGGRAHLQAVKVGLSNDEQAEILDGLKEHDQVILTPESNLTEGTGVQATATESADAS